MYHLLPTCHVSIDDRKHEVLGIKMFATSFFGVLAKFVKSEYYIRFICLSFRLEQFSPKMRDFHRM